MCIICRGEYKGEKILNCGDCTSLVSLPPLPNVTTLGCSGCTSLTSLSNIPNMTTLNCYGCTSLIALPEIPNMTHLYCGGCTFLVSLPDMTNIFILDCHSCIWLNHSSNSEYHINISNLSRIQRWYRRMVWCRYLASKEFIEWCYCPDNIGGKQSKRAITFFTETI